MDILFRSVEDLCFGIENFQERIKFYQDNVYENIYFISQEGLYLGFRNEMIDKFRLNVNDNVFFKNGVTIDQIQRFFKENPKYCRVPVLKNRRIIGEYYNSRTIGKSLAKEIEDKSLEIGPKFRNQLLTWAKNKDISFIGHANYNSLFCNLFGKVKKFERFEDGQIVIDTEFTNDYRKIVRDFSEKYTSFSSILISVLVKEVTEFLKKHDVKFYIIRGIRKSMLKQYFTEFEKHAIKMSLEEFAHDESLLNQIYKDAPDSKDMLTRHKNDISLTSTFVSNGIHNILIDHSEPGFNIVDGKRLTIGTPKLIKKSIHIFGPCVVQGLCVVDSETIPSLIQKKINEMGFTGIGLFNHGLAYGTDLLNDLLYMLSVDYKKNDIVLWLNAYSESELELFKKCQIPIIDLFDSFVNEHNWFCNNPLHCSKKGNEIYSQGILQAIEPDLILYNTESSFNYIEEKQVDLSYDSNCILESYAIDRYLKSIEKYRILAKGHSKIGAVVISANPCTKGHVHLIEEALKKIDFLYIFLVEESRDGFDYLEREDMVKACLQNKENICVLAGGLIHTSKLSFPEYFNRNEKHENISPSLHLQIFGQKVAPYLNITCRFFGEEPNDYVTSALNRSALDVLGKFGIETIIIPRKTDKSGIPISAKNVRNLLRQRDYPKLAELVPRETLIRLINKNGDQNAFDMHHLVWAKSIG